MRCNELYKKVITFLTLFHNISGWRHCDEKWNTVRNVIFSYKGYWSNGHHKLVYVWTDGRFLRMDNYVASHQNNNCISDKFS